MKKILKKQQSLVEYCLFDAIENFSTYNEFFEDMDSYHENDTVLLNINSCGGRIDVGMMIVKAIQNSKAHVIGFLSHPSYSMASIIALSCDDLYFDDNVFLMFHNYHTFIAGKGGAVNKDAENYNRYANEMLAQICTPFLTKKEVARIYNDEDLYISDKDAGLEDRIKRHFKRRRTEV